MKERKQINIPIVEPPGADTDLAPSEYQNHFLLVHHQQGLQTTKVARTQSVIVGRDPTVDIVVPDAMVSFRHARFQLDDKGVVWVEDLNSTNGTWVGGQRVTRCALKADDVVVIGEASIIFDRIQKEQELLPGTPNHEQFVDRLHYEITRSRSFGRPLGLLMLKKGSGEWSEFKKRVLHIPESLRPVDQLAIYSKEIIEILLPECSKAQILPIANQLLHGEGETMDSAGGPAVLCGIALFPETGNSAEELITVCLQALQRTSVAEPLLFARPKTGYYTAVGAAEQAPPETETPVVVSPKMRDVFDTVKRVASSAAPVLIIGETGTGKELVARSIHQRSGRGHRPMVTINCGAIPEPLVESTLFGHRKGAFTGADQEAKGLFEAAHRSTLFLDEIGELPLAAQTALLRVLEEKRICRVGSTKEIPVDVRVVAATHRDLKLMCHDGSFRSDLFYRLNVVTIKIPPLRERREEILVLAETFLEAAAKANRRPVRGFHPQAFRLLIRYSWPGNVRELRNIIERAVLLATDDEVTINDLSEGIRALGEDVPAAPEPAAGGVSQLKGGAEDEGLDFKTRIQKIETVIILDALRQVNWNQSKAAELLRIPQRTLTRKLSAYGIRAKAPEGDSE